MKSNSDKYRFITITNKSPQNLVGNSSIGSSSCENLLGVKISSDLVIMLKICKKINEELRALARATPYMKTEKILKV